MSECAACNSGVYDACFRSTETYVFCFVFKDADGNPISLAGKQFVLTVKRDARDATPLIQKSSLLAEIDIEPGAETGKVVCEIPQAEIAALYNMGNVVGVWFMTMEPGLGTTDPTQVIGGQVKFRGGN